MLPADHTPMPARLDGHSNTCTTAAPAVKSEDHCTKDKSGRSQKTGGATESYTVPAAARGWRPAALGSQGDVGQEANKRTVVNLAMVIRAAIAQAVEMGFNPPPSCREISAALDLAKRSFPFSTPGRPPDPTVTRAVELRLRECTWLDVYKEVIANFVDLEPADRMVRTTRLRGAVSRRIKSDSEKALRGLST
jgi:hypothetical protein